MPFLIAVSTIKVCTLNAVEQSDALLALGAGSHFHPRAAMVLTPAFTMKSIEAPFTEEVPALVAEHHCVFGVAFDTDLLFGNPLPLLIVGTFKLLDQVTITLHEITEVFYIFYFPLLTHSIAVMAESTTQYVNEIWFVFNVNAENPGHFNDVIHSFHMAIWSRPSTQ